MTILLLIAAAFGAGVMNAVAGGGSFLTFPALIFAGVPSIQANASSTVALFPASFASAWAYRDDFKPFPGVSFKAILAVSLAGGAAGALLLLWTPQKTFDYLVPWLLLGATLLFAFGRKVTPYLRRVFTLGPNALLALQFVISVYGGYFGGAIGILMLAAYGLFGLTDLNAMNAMKALLAGMLNGVAVICFIIADKVVWTHTLAMLAGAVVGGYVGARVARRMNADHVRAVIILIGMGMTIVFFIRT